MNADKEELIRKRAREIWEREGQPEGRATEHWGQATREVEAELAFTRPTPAENARKGKSAKTRSPGTTGSQRKGAKRT
jgi:hypothetical protein